MITITDNDRDLLQEYIDEMDILTSVKPEYDINNPVDLNEWNKQCADLTEKYSAVISRALDTNSNGYGLTHPQAMAAALKIMLADSEGQRDNKNVLHTRPLQFQTFGIMNDKMNHTMMEYPPEVEIIDKKVCLSWGVRQSGKKTNNQVISTIALYYEDDSRIITPNDKMTGMDEAVFTAVSNMIYKQRFHTEPPYCFTPEDIWRYMNGISGKKSPTLNQKRKICNSIDKMISIGIYMEINQEIESGYIKINDPQIEARIMNGILNEPLLYGEKASFRSEKGRCLDGYAFYDIPLLYWYNCIKGHIILVDAALLDTSDTTSLGGNIIEFRNYLLREIALRYNYKRNSSRIRIEPLYKNCSVHLPKEKEPLYNYKNEHSYKTAVKQSERNDLSKISAILDSWVKKEWILGHEEVKIGKDDIAVDIRLNPEKYKSHGNRQSLDNNCCCAA